MMWSLLFVLTMERATTTTTIITTTLHPKGTKRNETKHSLKIKRPEYDDDHGGDKDENHDDDDGGGMEDTWLIRRNGDSLG